MEVPEEADYLYKTDWPNQLLVLLSYSTAIGHLHWPFFNDCLLKVKMMNLL